MNTGDLTLAAFIVTAVGWTSREIWRWRKARRLATEDATKTLNQKKRLLEDIICKTDDNSTRQMLSAQLDEVNAALLGLYAKRLRQTLRDAGLPAEEMLIADGRRRLQSQEGTRLEASIEQLKSLPPFLSTEDLLVLGNAYYFMERYDNAKKIYDMVLNLNTDDPSTLNSRAVTYAKLGRHEEALTDYNRALELKPDDPTILMNRGVTYYNLKRYEEALADHNRSLEIRPDDPMTLNNRGAAYAGLGRREEALVDYNRCLQILEHPHALYNRGMTYKYLGQYTDALNDFNRSLELNSADSDTLYELGCLSSLWGKTDDALAYLKRAIALDKKRREKTKTDEDLDNIQDDPRFKRLIELD